ncbi:glycosyltransferase family 2 protein [Candidatus Micrarchaeota archaeon]|nr:glycosyltransferase family 2 protein [Candidatus Micrarchaeota archaeon]
MKGAKIKVSVIMPAYNEGKNLQAAAAGVLKQRVGELVIVDDGSTDSTLEVAKRLSRGDPRVRIVSYHPNRGKGYAMRSGARAASNSALVFIDSDSQFDASYVGKMAAALDGADMVVGYRDPESIPPSRRLANAFARVMVFIATGKTVRDVLSGFRAIRKQDFDALKPREDRFEIESELSLKALKRRFRIRHVSVPVVYHGGANKLRARHSIRISIYLIKGVLKCWSGYYA